MKTQKVSVHVQTHVSRLLHQLSPQAAQAQSQEDIAANAARAAVIDVDADAIDAPSPESRKPQPCRSLEQLVKELDELERPAPNCPKRSKKMIRLI